MSNNTATTSRKSSKKKRQKHAVPQDETALYRWFDSDNVLIYVGVTNDLLRRQSQHEYGSVWTTFAATATIEQFQTRKEALAAEARAISTEGPVFNVQGNNRPVDFLRLMDYLRTHDRVELADEAFGWPRQINEKRLNRALGRVVKTLRADYPELSDGTSAEYLGNCIQVALRFESGHPCNSAMWLKQIRTYTRGGGLWLYAWPHVDSIADPSCPEILGIADDEIGLAAEVDRAIRTRVMPSIVDLYDATIRAERIREVGYHDGAMELVRYRVRPTIPQIYRCGAFQLAAIRLGYMYDAIDLVAEAYGKSKSQCSCGDETSMACLPCQAARLRKLGDNHTTKAGYVALAKLMDAAIEWSSSEFAEVRASEEPGKQKRLAGLLIPRGSDFDAVVTRNGAAW